MFFMGVAGYTQVMIRASAPRAEADNRDLHHALDRHRWHRMIYSAASTLLALACWAVYDVAALEQYSLVVTLTIGTIVVVWVISSVPYWNRVLTYAQGIQSTQSA